jgi:hypothetical protein
VVALTLSPTLSYQELVRLVRGAFSRAAGVVLLDAYNVSPAQAAALRAGSPPCPRRTPAPVRWCSRSAAP